MNLALVGSSDEIFQTAKELAEAGNQNIKAFQVDIANEEQVTEMVKETNSAFQSIDVLVNNAGIGFFKTVDETTLDEWKKVFEVNVQGVFVASKAVLSHPPFNGFPKGKFTYKQLMQSKKDSLREESVFFI